MAPLKRSIKQHCSGGNNSIVSYINRTMNILFQGKFTNELIIARSLMLWILSILSVSRQSIILTDWLSYTSLVNTWCATGNMAVYSCKGPLVPNRIQIINTTMFLSRPTAGTRMVSPLHSPHDEPFWRKGVQGGIQVLSPVAICLRLPTLPRTLCLLGLSCLHECPHISTMLSHHKALYVLCLQFCLSVTGFYMLCSMHCG